MHAGVGGKASPEEGESQGRAAYEGEGEASIFFARGPGCVSGLRFVKEVVVEEVDEAAEEGADADWDDSVWSEMGFERGVGDLTY